MCSPRLYLTKLPAPDGAKAHEFKMAPLAKFPTIPPERRAGMFWTWIARLCARNGA